MTCTILFPVDGSNCSLRAARHVAGMAGSVAGLHVHLVNVQPRGDDWMVRRSYKPEELEAMEKQWGETAVAAARDMLTAAGIPLTVHIVQGEIAPTIARLAVELGCDQIIMGTRGKTALKELILGSEAHKVLHLASVPVTFVK
jgi:nucleotide-binding universal stress UspA family protein